MFQRDSEMLYADMITSARVTYNGNTLPGTGISAAANRMSPIVAVASALLPTSVDLRRRLA